MRNKKFLLALFIVIAVIGTVTTGWGIMTSQRQPSDLELANIEALSGEETGSGKKCYKSITEKESSKILFCGSCDFIDNATDTWYSGVGTC